MEQNKKDHKKLAIVILSVLLSLSIVFSLFMVYCLSLEGNININLENKNKDLESQLSEYRSQDKVWDPVLGNMTSVILQSVYKMGMRVSSPNNQYIEYYGCEEEGCTLIRVDNNMVDVADKEVPADIIKDATDKGFTIQYIIDGKLQEDTEE